MAGASGLRKSERARRGRAERPTLRDAQRRLTRSRIIDAARELFATRPYVVVSADEIASAASIGRATFYLHFGGKEEVLRTILAEDLDRQESSIHLLASLTDPSRSDLARWIESMFRGYERRRASTQLFSLIVGLDPGYMKHLNAMQDNYIEILSPSHPAFRLPEDPAARERRRTEIHVLFYELTDLAFHLAWPDCGLDRAAAVEDATNRLQAFLTSPA